MYSAWWGGRLPAKLVVGTFYRITRGKAATLDDFKSNAALGKRPRDRETWDADDYRAGSTYSNPADALRAMQLFPSLGRYAARLVITRGARITGRWQPDQLRSHWNLWGEPAELLRFVRQDGLDADMLDALGESQ